MIDFCGIQPPIPYLVEPHAQIPLGLCYVVAAAQEHGYDAVVYDGSTQEPAEVADGVPNAHVYGLTAAAIDYPTVEDVARHIREKHPDATIILGGPVQTAHKYVDYSVFDSLVKGYADDAIGDILGKALDGQDIPHQLPCTMPDPDLVTQPHRVWPGSLGSKGSMHPEYENATSSVIITSRGCPHHCAFCCAPVLCNKVQFRDFNSVFKDVDYLVENGVRVLRISDDSFMAKTDRVREWCKRIKPYHEKHGIVWRPSFRVDSADLDLFQLMSDTGCVEGCVGVESMDPKVLNMLNKGTSPEQIRRCLRLMGEAGIKRRVMIMTGCPGSSWETYERNTDFIMNGDFEYLSLTSFVPLPGSAVWQNPGDFECELADWTSDLENLQMFFYTGDGTRHAKPAIYPHNYDFGQLELQMNSTRRIGERQRKVNDG